jgi:hypothetical protein
VSSVSIGLSEHPRRAIFLPTRFAIGSVFAHCAPFDELTGVDLECGSQLSDGAQSRTLQTVLEPIDGGLGSAGTICQVLLAKKACEPSSP